MSLWNVYVGAFTKEFADEVQRINQTANIFWKGTYPRFTATPSEGIERLTFDDATGAIRHLGNAAGDLVNPAYLALHPSKPILYAAEWSRQGRLTAFAIRGDGTLERQSAIDTLGEFADLARGRQLSLIADSSVDPGGALVEIGRSTLDGQLRTALERVRAVLIGTSEVLA